MAVAGEPELAGQIAVSIGSVQDSRKAPSPAEKSETIRVQRLREDAERPLSENLAEGIALSHKLMRFTGVAIKR